MTDDLLAYAARVQTERLGEPLGPSSAGACYRQLAYRYHDVPHSDNRSTDAADIGTLLHLGWSTMIRAQYDPAERDVDVTIRIPGLPRSGQADDVDYVNHIVTDVKSANGRAWQAMVDRNDVYPNYWDQLSCYALGLFYDGFGDFSWLMRIVLLNRDTGERAEFTKPFDLDHAEAVVKVLAGRHDRLVESRMEVGSPEQFPREGRGPGTGWPCDWCPMLSRCWPDPFGDYTPQSETIHDDPDAVEGWASEYLEAQQEEGKAKERKQAAAAFLRGIVGSFGAFRVTFPGGKPRDPVIDCDKAAAMLTKAGLEVPMKNAGTTPKYVRVNRINTKG